MKLVSFRMLEMNAIRGGLEGRPVANLCRASLGETYEL